MKVVLISCLTLAVLAHGSSAYTYNGYANREFEKNRVKQLFGSHLAKSQREPNADGADNNLRQRRTEGEVPVPPDASSVDEGNVGGDGRFQQSFYTAESLDYFKNGLDPDLFEWVNPDEVVPSGWTCGFMKPPLGSAPGLTYPAVEVYICARFANKQPAKKGNVFTHCGGPGTASTCGMMFGLGEAALDDFNFFTIDQRGVGRSWPSFSHEACMNSVLTRAENGTIVGREYPEDLFLPDFTDVESIKASLEPQKRQTLNCWTCEDCDFKLSAEQEDGTTHAYHFLEYSGTRQLAEDIERMRVLINAPVMHVYGVSYGTQVFGTYATIFPESVGLFVLDGNVNPYQNYEKIAHDQATGQNTRISYGLFSCSARNVAEPGSCPVDDLPKCISDISSIFQDSFGFGPVNDNLGLIIQVMGNAKDRAQELCDLAASGDGEAFDQLSGELINALNPTAETKQLEGTIHEFNSESGPTRSKEDTPKAQGTVYGNPEYNEIAVGGGIFPSIVNLQDAFSALYDADYFARRVKEFGEFYTGAGTGSPVRTFYGEWSAGFNWPKGVPLAPMGNPLLTGIIAGQLYDPDTPYVWTQAMRENFKYASLLTSQSTQHGLDYNDPSCQKHVIDYFNQGFIDFVDGTVCGAEFGDESLIVDAFGNGF